MLKRRNGDGIQIRKSSERATAWIIYSATGTKGGRLLAISEDQPRPPICSGLPSIIKQSLKTSSIKIHIP